MTRIAYKKLARAQPRRFFSVAAMARTSLWLGPDHLLFVESSGFNESYKRFYFRDIQALTLRRTNTARNINIILGVITFFFGFLGLAVVHDDIGKIFMLGFAAIFGLLLTVNAVGGTSCRCYLKTAVQTEELSALSRLRRARKVLNKIRPLIVAAQGGQAPPPTAPNLPGQGIQNAPVIGTPVAPPASEPASVPPRLEN